MYIENGIAYAGNPVPVIKVCGIRPMQDFRLWIRFSTGEAKVFDCRPLLKDPAFAPLADKEVFSSVYIDFGVPVWNEGAIDIAPEYLYEHGEKEGEKTA